MTNGNFDKLTKLITIRTIEFMELLGTTPENTCRMLADEVPDLYEAFGHDRFFRLCQVIHFSEIRTASKRLQKRFSSLNNKYFAGSLPEHEIRVVSDVRVWAKVPSRGPVDGYVDSALQVIFIRHSWPRTMCHSLLCQMAHLATSTTDDSDKRWIQEMARLETLDAPLLPTESEPSDEVAPPILWPEHFDQSSKLAHLRSWVEKVSKRLDRMNLCQGLTKLLDEDALRYGFCHPSSQTRKAFGAANDLYDLTIVADEAPSTALEPVTSRVLMELILGDMVVLPVLRKGQPDLMFYTLDRPGSEVLAEGLFREMKGAILIRSPKRTFSRRAIPGCTESRRG